MFKEIFNKLFEYKPIENYEFIIPNISNNISESEFENNTSKYVFKDLDDNLEYLKGKYNMIINKDIKTRNFTITLNNHKIPAFIIYIDGIVNDENINDYILKPLLLKNSIKMKESNLSIQNKINFNIEKFLYNSLIPQNSVSKEKDFSEIIDNINSGFCALFVDGINTALCIETKDIKGRSIDKPVSEVVVNGAHEAFIENIRTNTSLIRKIISNEDLIIEESTIGKVSKTKVAICYMKNITNPDLVSETKYRINNLNIDFLLSSGQLEQFIKDSPTTSFPQLVSTERPDRAAKYLLIGRVVILVDGSPFATVVPSILIDFLTSPEDSNLNYHYANFLKVIRLVALVGALLIPGLYVAIAMYHFELIPSELLFAIISSREAIPFPILFEIIIMELCFELIQEASIRVSSSFSTTVGIIGALILGDAAVSANIVSPILIIIVAFSGICSFAIPDNSLRFAIRVFRFMYIILGYFAGFLGIAFGFFIHFTILSNNTSFGIPYFTPYIPYNSLLKNETLYVEPVWKRETRSNYLNTQKPQIEENISMVWRKNGKKL